MIKISRISKVLLTTVGLLSISTHAFSTENNIHKNNNTETYGVGNKQQDVYKTWYDSALAKKDIEKEESRRSAAIEGEEDKEALLELIYLYFDRKPSNYAVAHANSKLELKIAKIIKKEKLDAHTYGIDWDDWVVPAEFWLIAIEEVEEGIDILTEYDEPGIDGMILIFNNYILVLQQLANTPHTIGQAKTQFNEFWLEQFRYIEEDYVNDYVELHQPDYDVEWEKQKEIIEAEKVKINELYNSFKDYGIDVEYKVGVFGLDDMESAGLFANNRQQIEINTKLRATYLNSETDETELLDITVNDYKEGFSFYEESSGNYINHDWKQTDNIYNNDTNKWHATVNRGKYVGHLPTNICNSGTNVPEYHSGGFTEQESAKASFYISTNATPSSQQMCTSLNLTLSNYYDLPIIYDSCKTKEQKFPVTAFKPVTYDNDDIKMSSTNTPYYAQINYIFTDRNSRPFMDYDIVEYSDAMFPSEHSDQQGHRFIRTHYLNNPTTQPNSVYASLYRGGATTNLAGLKHKNCPLPLEELPLPNGFVASLYRVGNTPLCEDDNRWPLYNYPSNEHPLAIKLMDKYGNKSETMTIHLDVFVHDNFSFNRDKLRFTMNGKDLEQ